MHRGTDSEAFASRQAPAETARDTPVPAIVTQLVTPEQKASELLFPAEDGGLRSVSFLKKAFATVGTLIGLNKRVTPRGMRRTFNDLARAANVEAIVTKSISGHQTDRMRDHYSTVTPDEQRRSIGNVGSLFGPRESGEVGRDLAEWGGF